MRDYRNVIMKVSMSNLKWTYRDFENMSLEELDYWREVVS